MSLKLILIGSSYPEKDYTINCPTNSFTLQEIYDILVLKDIELNNLMSTRFIFHGQTIYDINKKYTVLDDNTIHLYLFSQDKTIRDILSTKIFMESTDISLTITNTKQPIVDELDIITKEECNIINQQIIDQFKDPDFKKLLEICITKPHLLGIVNNYISNGNVISEIPMLNETDEFNYMEVYCSLEMLGFKLNNMLLFKSIITYFEGSINLIIRYILLKNLTQDSI
jgi:hypothetical protein